MSEVRRIPWPRDPRYLAGEDGTIIGPRGIIRGTPGKLGHVLITFRETDGRRRTIGQHVVVCETFHGPCPPGHEAAHANGRGGDNRPENLSWKTRPDNNQDKLNHGTYGQKLTREQVQEIRRARGVVPQNKLAKQYGVTELTIRHIWRGHTWRGLPWPDGLAPNVGR